MTPVRLRLIVTELKGDSAGGKRVLDSLYFKRSASSSLVSIDLGVGLRLSAMTRLSLLFRRSTPSLAFRRDRIHP